MGQSDSSSPHFVVASHEMLFESAEETHCDACGCAIDAAALDADSDEGSSLGRGVYLRTRGGEAWLEHVPLCSGCAAAIGVTALARWEIEEEEG